MKIYYNVNDKKSGLTVGVFNDIKQAQEMKKANANYFISLRWEA